MGKQQGGAGLAKSNPKLNIITGTNRRGSKFSSRSLAKLNCEPRKLAKACCLWHALGSTIAEVIDSSILLLQATVLIMPHV